MSDKDIKEAVEWVRNYYATDFQTGKKSDNNLEILLDLAQRYLSASSVMPEKSDMNFDDIAAAISIDARNETIDACTLAILKKCEGLEKVIGETNCHIPEIGRRVKDSFHPSFIELLATTIRKHMEE